MFVQEADGLIRRVYLLCSESTHQNGHWRINKMKRKILHFFHELIRVLDWIIIFNIVK